MKIISIELNFFLQFLMVCQNVVVLFSNHPLSQLIVARRLPFLRVFFSSSAACHYILFHLYIATRKGSKKKGGIEEEEKKPRGQRNLIQ